MFTGECDLGYKIFALLEYGWTCGSWLGIIFVVLERTYFGLFTLYYGWIECSFIFLKLLKPVGLVVIYSYVYRFLFFYLSMIFYRFYF